MGHVVTRELLSERRGLVRDRTQQRRRRSSAQAMPHSIRPIFLLTCAALVALVSLATPLSAQSQRYLFVSPGSGTGSGWTILAWRVDIVGGAFAFTPAPGSPFNAPLEPVAFAVHPSGKFLFVANQNQTLSDVSVYSIDPTSTTSLLTLLPASPFSTGLSTHPVAMVVEPAGKYLYVVNTDGQSSGSILGPPPIPFYGSIDSYSIDQTTGALAPTSSSYANLPAYPIAVNPAMADPIGNYLYVAGQDGTSGATIVTFQIDPLTGNLSSGVRQPGGNINRCAATDPLGRFIALCGGQIEGIIFVFPIQQGIPGGPGTTFVVRSPLEDFPTSLTVDETGSYLYALFGISGLRGFSIDSGFGLTELPGSPFSGPSGPLTADPTGPILYGSGVPSQIATDGALTPLSGLTLQLTPGVTALATLGPSSGQPISGPAAALPTAVDFGSSNVGATLSSAIRLSNTGRATLFISSRVIIGPNASDFVVQSDNCLPALPPNGTCQFNITFTPSAVGARQATLQVTDNASGGPQLVTLNGSGAAPAPGVILPSNVTFPDTFQGVTSAAQNITVISSGTADLHVSGVTLGGANSADFKVKTDSCTGVSIPPNNNCIVSVTFTPAAQGARSASITVANDASSGLVNLIGNSKPPFTISGSTSAPPVPAGQPTQYSLQVTPATNFSGTVIGACSGAPMPTGVTCTVGTLVPLNGASGTPVPFMVNVSTMPRSALVPSARWPRLDPHGPLPLPWLAAIAALLLAVWMAIGNRKVAARGAQRLAIRFAPAALLLCLSLALAACGSGGGSSYSPPPPGSAGTPAGTYNLTVTLTASSGAVAQQQLMLIVQ
jgi:6-phosphogluconolactonase (cycloisomerase 2 family)